MSVSYCKVRGRREDDDHRAKALLQTMRDAGDAPDTGGDELATIGNCQHGNGGTDGVDDEQQRFPFDVGSSCDHSEDRREHGSGAGSPYQT